MIDSIINKFFKHTIYVEFSDEWICVKHVETGNTFEDKPLMAIKQNQKDLQGGLFQIEDRAINKSHVTLKPDA